MIAKNIKDFCSTPELIENYTEAVASPKLWVCHHRRELEFTCVELTAMGEYFHRPPEELIFLTISQHRHLHMTVCKGWEKQIQRQRELNTGANNPMYGISLVVSEKTKAKMSASHKGNTAVRGKHWWNNGVISVRSKECPGPGYVRGRKLVDNSQILKPNT